MVHGEEGLAAARRITASLFSGSLSDMTEADFAHLAQAGMPTIELEGDAALQHALVTSELEPSRGRARTAITSNAVVVNGEKQADPEYKFSANDRLFDRYTLLRRGKKNYCLAVWK